MPPTQNPLPRIGSLPAYLEPKNPTAEARPRRILSSTTNCSLTGDGEESNVKKAKQPLTFPRYPIKKPRRLSILGLMIAGQKEWAKSPHNSPWSYKPTQNNLEKHSSNSSAVHTSSSEGQDDGEIETISTRSK